MQGVSTSDRRGETMQKIKELINQQRYQEARIELDVYKENATYYDDVLAILEATLFFQEGNWQEAYFCIQEGLSYNPRNYELYYMLGNYYAPINVDQAYLCYENAVYYCENEDIEYIRQYKDDFKYRNEVTVRTVAIVILSYNTETITKQCIESIRRNIFSDTYELIVVDNASVDGSVAYLKQQADLKFLCNDENKGFPGGCNQGILLAKEDSDIFLLNSDTIVPENAVFWLRMGLYESDSVGATSSVSNNVTNYQRIVEEEINDQNYQEIASKYNLPMYFAYEEKSWLVGFALLIKRTVLNQVGLLDELFHPGNYEDIDLGFRIAQSGYRQRLCLNSFIFHYGSTGFKKNPEKYLNLLQTNLDKFIQKWDIDPIKSTRMNKELISLITKDPMDKFHLLYIGCGSGATMARIQRLYPYAVIEGIEKNPKLAKIASASFSVTCLDVQEIYKYQVDQPYDYIVVGSLLEHTRNPQNLLHELFGLLAEDGKILGSVYNLMFAQYLSQLLTGNFSYQESGMIQKSHLHHYTLEELIQLTGSSGYQIKDFYFTTKEELYSDLCKQQYDGLKTLLGRNQELLKAYQFYFSLEKKSDAVESTSLDRLEESSYYSMERNEVITLITHDKDKEITVLEVGCGSGASLRKIKQLYPNAKVYGIEMEEELVRKNPYQLNLISGNIEQMVLPYEEAMFDYIIFADVLEQLYDPNMVLRKFKPYLKPNGFVISSISNMLHSSVIVPLMRGRFTYRNSGILDPTHIRLFTLHEIIRIFENCGYSKDQIIYSEGVEEESLEAKSLLQKISELPGSVDQEQFHVFRYHVRWYLGNRVTREIQELEKQLEEKLSMHNIEKIYKMMNNLSYHILEESEHEKAEAITHLIQLAKKYHGDDLYKAIILLSFIFKEFKEEECISILVDLALQKEVNLRREVKYYIFQQIQVLIFRTPELDTKANRDKTQILYQHIFDRLCDKYQERLIAIPRDKRDKKKVFVMTDQFLGERHAPTHSALERSFYLSSLGDKRVKIVNTLGASSTKGRIIWWKYYYSHVIEEYVSLTEYSYKDQTFEFWQAKHDLFDDYGINAILDLVIAEKPDYILNIGGQSIIADLCSKLVPTIAVATVFSKLPVTLGTFSVIGRTLSENEWKELLAKGIVREAIRELPFTFELTQQTNHFKREDYLIPANAFALAVVGTRLVDDVTDEFIHVLEQTYVFGTHIVFVGVFDTYEEMCDHHPGLKEHSSYLGYCQDVLAIMELCNLYVNPKRRGGGFSVIEAFYQKIPGVSINYGDAATAAGKEFCVDTYQEMMEEILHYQSDSSYYEEKSIQAKKRADFMTDGSKVFIQAMESIEQSPLFF